MIGLIPAAGKGSRLSLPFPKELFPVIRNGDIQPVITNVVDDMIFTGIKHLVFVINESKHQIIGYLGSGKKYKCNFSYVVQENISKEISSSPGLADALISAYHLIREKTVLFGMADTIMSPRNVFDLGLLSMNDSTDLMLCLFPTITPENFGMVSFDVNGNVNKVFDKPKNTNLEYMWGCMIWRPRFSDYLWEKVYNERIGDFSKIINFAIQDKICIKSTIIKDGKFQDLGTQEQITKFFKDGFGN
mgnify:CR=1 FL=1